MKELNMEKIVYVHNGTHIPYTLKYKELEKELVNDNEIMVQFPQGTYSRRMKQLEKLGFKLVSWEWKPTEKDPIWSPYKGIFER